MYVCIYTDNNITLYDFLLKIVKKYKLNDEVSKLCYISIFYKFSTD